MSIIPPIPPSDDGREGERRRDEAINRLRFHRAVIVRRLQRAAVGIALDTGRVTADDVRGRVPIPRNITPKTNGAAFRELAEAGILAAVGYRLSVRPEAHRRPVTEWRLADRAAAMQWLAAHPDYPTDWAD